MQVTERICSVPPKFEREIPEVGQGPPPLFSFTNHTRGLKARWLLRVPPCRKATILLQTSMSSTGFEPSPYGTVVSVANHYTGCSTPAILQTLTRQDHDHKHVITRFSLQGPRYHICD
ncbi:hypothetical protein TNCV_506671 [Trichonephila clavipes]|nr:hypothetical protein TNCV_506671 [Trichonephila clavipes]